MAIQISNLTPVAGEIPQNDNGKKREIIPNTGQSSADEVTISGDASFISNLKGSIDSAQSAPQAKISAVKRQVAAGTYADSSKIAEGLINGLNIAGE